MTTLEDVRSATGLCPDEMIVGVTETEMHRAVLASYLSNLWRGPEVVRDLMLADIRSALDLGVAERAADLLLVLRRFLSMHPEAAHAACPCVQNTCDVQLDGVSGRYQSHCPNLVELNKKLAASARSESPSGQSQARLDLRSLSTGIGDVIAEEKAQGTRADRGQAVLEIALAAGIRVALRAPGVEGRNVGAAHVTLEAASRDERPILVGPLEHDDGHSRA